MAIRIHTAITHGEIDNTQRGRVRARLWLLGREEAVQLDLDGDAWRDVAGTRVSFVNPSAETQAETGRLLPLQKGVVGDITASRKVKVFTVPEEEWRQAYREDRIEDVPTELRNSLYLEWFTAEQGRCVVESADFEITISDHVWEMDEDEEGAQRMANMHAMRDFLAGIIQRPELPEDEEDDDDDDMAEEPNEGLSEEDWEEQLKASDRLTDASLEAYEKYGEDEDSDEKTAFVMGWDHLLEVMADAQEGVEADDDDSEEKKRRREWAEAMNEAVEDAENGDDWQEDTEEEDPEEPHPLKDQARDLLVSVMNDLDATDLNDARGNDPQQPLDRFMTHLMQISSKLAGALHNRRDIADPAGRGYILAISKRCLNWSNEALSAIQDLQNTEAHAAHHAVFARWQASLFSLRDGLVRLRDEMRGA